MSRRFELWLTVGIWLVARPIFAQQHALDPLSRGELDQGIALLEREKAIGGSVLLALMGLHPPDKKAILAGQSVPRLIAATTYDRAANHTTELVLDIASGTIVNRKLVRGVSPVHLASDHTVAANILRADRRWRELVQKGGKNPDSVRVFAYPIGSFAPPGTADRLAIVRAAGVTAYVNLTSGRVYRTDVVGLGPGDAESSFNGDAVGQAPESPLRTELRGGPGYRRDGWGVEWGPWSFRIGLAPKEGLTLYLVKFGAPGQRRSLVYQAGLSELWVPYGDRGQRDFYLNAFDIGEVGIARYGRPEMSRTDCPMHAEFLPISFLDTSGQPIDIAQGFCLYERDGGIAWRHGTVGRRNQQLVLSSVFRIDNYDYGLNWVFHQDGTLEAEVLLSGIMNARPVAHAHAPVPVADTSYATLVAPRVEAMHHQHFFNFRLDVDLAESDANSVVEMNTLAPPIGPANPHGNAIQLRQTVLTRELVARRQLDLPSHRFWRVLSGRSRNDLGQPLSYALWPGENTVPYAKAGTLTRARAGYTDYHLWVTPYAEGEWNAAGSYVYQSGRGAGLPTWTKRDRPIANRDVVLWYTLGITHVPRPEDWPVMPVHRAGFRLAPFGYFSRNPLLDQELP